MRICLPLYRHFFFCALILFIIAPQSVVKAADDVDDETCLTCHEGYDRSLAQTAHRLSSQTESPEVKIGCTNCHPGAEEHVNDPSPANMQTAAELVSLDAISLCTQCHKAHEQLDDYGFDAHSSEQLSCADCHKVHGANPALLLDDSAEFCLKCHSKMRNSFAKTSNHPVLQADLTCLSCHRFSKRKGNNLAYEFAGTCRRCHPEQGAPHVYEHEAVNSYTIEGSGCTQCHDPHGSANDRLLRQPDNRLCEQCHFPAGHKTAHGGIWAKYACEQCHVDIHGSYVSNLFLDPDLPAKFSGDCYNIGCHSLIK